MSLLCECLSATVIISEVMGCADNRLLVLLGVAPIFVIMTVLSCGELIR